MIGDSTTGSRRSVAAKMRPKGPQSADVDGLLRQKSICDNQSHHARENQHGGEDFRIIGPVELRAADGAG
jgi:hypothetical protein